MFNNFVIKLSCSIIAQKSKLYWSMYYWVRGSTVLAHGYAGQFPGDPMLIYVCCVWHVFLCLSTNFFLNTNTIYICLILSTIYIFIPVSGCVGRAGAPEHFLARIPIMLFTQPLFGGVFSYILLISSLFCVWIVGFFLYQFRWYMWRSYSLIR